ncbi:MAG: hypothetical protein QOI24_3704 [Acidobacteriota bacterium]|nr:hypothetical protein [Acidobacteriota bacterium]
MLSAEVLSAESLRIGLPLLSTLHSALSTGSIIPGVSDIDTLRDQLKERGYLAMGIERWFALDPWSSRAFWLELATVALKGATLIALFGVLPLVAVMLFRNHPLSVSETFLITLLYGAGWLAVAFAFLVAVALLFRSRPQLAVDTPRALLAISFVAAAALTFVIAFWWYRFDTAPSIAELAAGIALMALFFIVASIVVSAAMLSFSIYELHRVPAIHQKPRGVPMSIAAAILIALLFLPAWAAQERTHEAPVQVVTTPTTHRIALVAVDGLTFELLPSLQTKFATIAAVKPVAGESTAERWASLGTGVETRAHGVRAIEGIRMRGGQHVLQSLSRADVILRDVAPLIGLARREPLPPTVRKRDYIWELFAARGVPSAAVNWWTTEDTKRGALEEIGQASVFAAIRDTPESAALKVDASASRKLLAIVDRSHPRFATAYLPALDVILNRLTLDPSTQFTASARALDGVKKTIEELHARGYEVVIAGLPGDHQRGSAVIASTLALQTPASAFDLAPTLCTALGFPASTEMPGTSRLQPEEPRIATYGNRATAAHSVKVDEEYYESLKSLGYIR